MFHVIRGFIGSGLARIFPTSHEIISKLDYSGDKRLAFGSVKPKLTSEIQKQLLDYYEDFELPAKAYTGITGLCFLIDLIAMLIYIGKVGISDDKKTEASVHLGQLISVVFYIILDVYFILWLAHFRFRLPEHMREYLPRALLGFG